MISLRIQSLAIYNPGNYIGGYIMARPKSDAKARFLSFVSKSDNGCHEWISTINNGGYGKFYYEGRQDLAHRVAFVLFKGKIPDDLCVLHTCDNRKCVNPDHLYIGTHKENTRDMFLRDRWHGNVKYAMDVISKCLPLYRSGATQQEIAKTLGISQQSVSRYVRGKFLNRKGNYYG